VACANTVEYRRSRAAFAMQSYRSMTNYETARVFDERAFLALAG